MCGVNKSADQGDSRNGFSGRGRSTDGHGQDGFWHKAVAYLNPLTWFGMWDGLKGGY